jgi:hypothetical protein
MAARPKPTAGRGAEQRQQQQATRFQTTEISPSSSSICCRASQRTSGRSDPARGINRGQGRPTRACEVIARTHEDRHSRTTSPREGMAAAHQRAVLETRCRQAVGCARKARPSGPEPPRQPQRGLPAGKAAVGAVGRARVPWHRQGHVVEIAVQRAAAPQGRPTWVPMFQPPRRWSTLRLGMADPADGLGAGLQRDRGTHRQPQLELPAGPARQAQVQVGAEFHRAGQVGHARRAPVRRRCAWARWPTG